MSNYVHPEVLVETEWLAENLSNPNVRIIESDEDVLLYDTGHIPGAIKINWQDDLNDPIIRDYLDAEKFATLLSEKGISPDTTVVFYGDKNNWWATYNLWVFKLFGHKDVRILNGGRKKWEDEKREFTKEVPSYSKANYKSVKRDDKKIRIFRDDVLKHVNKDLPLVDVRSPAEFTGEKLHMPEYPQEGALRGGHIPGAKNIPWAKAVNEDSTFKSYDDLKALYTSAGITPDKDIVTYCRIGERSSHSWFVLTYLLGYPKVRNYDGSWTEWGNSVNVPIEK